MNQVNGGGSVTRKRRSLAQSKLWRAGRMVLNPLAAYHKATWLVTNVHELVATVAKLREEQRSAVKRLDETQKRVEDGRTTAGNQLAELRRATSNLGEQLAQQTAWNATLRERIEALSKESTAASRLYNEQCAALLREQEAQSKQVKELREHTAKVRTELTAALEERLERRTGALQKDTEQLAQIREREAVALRRSVVTVTNRVAQAEATHDETAEGLKQAIERLDRVEQISAKIDSFDALAESLSPLTRMYGLTGARRCSICGSAEFGAGPGNRTDPHGNANVCCSGCGSLERHRVIHQAYQRIPRPFTRKLRALFVAGDRRIIDTAWFRSVDQADFSTDGSITAPQERYDWIACNYVLHRVANDRRAFEDLIARLEPRGVLQLSVPSPLRSVPIAMAKAGATTGDKPAVRTYGPEILRRIAATQAGLTVVSVVLTEPATSFRELVCFASFDQERLLALQTWVASGPTASMGPVWPVGANVSNAEIGFGEPIRYELEEHVEANSPNDAASTS